VCSAMTLRTFSLSARRDQPGKEFAAGGNNVNVISSTANVHEFGSEVAADCGQISMHARPHV
jgi:hypothetical protein